MNSPSQNIKQVQNYQFNMANILGRGSYGIVYQGTHKFTNEVVALKVIDHKTMNSVEVRNQLELEINIMKRFKHPNLVKLIDVFDSANNKYIVTEYCNGSDLREILKSKRFFLEAEALLVLKDILSGLKEMVSQNVIHRDLKPANIIKHNNSYKITDFGFSRSFEKFDMMQSLVGTPLYMAPQLLLKEQYSDKCDIWSIGMLYYELLVGQTPWVARSIPELLQNIQQQPLIFPSSKSISTVSRSFIMGCLQSSEMVRMSWEDVFNHPLIAGRSAPTPKHHQTPKLTRDRSTSTYQMAAKEKTQETKPKEDSNPNSSQSTLQNSSQALLELLQRPQTQRPAAQQDFYVPVPKTKAPNERMRRTRSQLENLYVYPKDEEPVVKDNTNRTHITKKLILKPQPSADNLFKPRYASLATTQPTVHPIVGVLIGMIEKHLMFMTHQKSPKPIKAIFQKETQAQPQGLLQLIKEHKGIVQNDGIPNTQIEQALLTLDLGIKFFKEIKTAESASLLVLLKQYVLFLKSVQEQKDNQFYKLPEELHADLDTVVRKIMKNKTSFVVPKLSMKKNK